MGVITVNQAADGSTAVNAASLNTNFNTIANVINGNLDANNIAANAITSTQLAANSVTNAKLSTTAGDPGGAWLPFTPTFNLIGGTTMGNAVLTGRYQQIGKTVNFWAQFVLGTTTNFTGLTSMTVNLPVIANSSYPANTGIGHVFMRAAGGFQLGRLMVASSTVAVIWAEAAGGTYVIASDITGSIPATWANGNSAVVSGTYEAA